MNDLADLERRIMTALREMERGLEKLGSAPAGPSQNERAMSQALATERQMTAQLKQGLQSVREMQDTAMAALERQLTEAAAELETRTRELEELAMANAQLQEALRQATETPPAAPAAEGREEELLQEIETLRLARAADLAEMDEILAALEPLIREAAHA